MSIEVISELVPLTKHKDGVLRIGKTRVTLDTVIGAFLDGATAEEIAQQYPVLSLADVYAVITYYLRRRKDVEQYLQHRKNQSAKVRNENESRYNPIGIRERLLARREGKKLDC